MRRILLVVCLLTVVFASLLAACSGGGKGKEEGSTTPQAAVTSSSQSTTPSDTTPSGGATSTPVPDPFAGLQSYHYVMEMSGDGADSVIIKGSVKAPDSIALDFYLTGSDTPVSSMIIIGTQAWSKSSSSGQWQQVDIAEAEGQVAGLLPKDFWGAFPFDQIISVSTDEGEETVNGVQARHYQINEAGPETMAKLAEIFGSADQASQPDKFSMDLWRAADGWAVKATISATYPEGSQITQATITWEVSDVNSSAVSIQPPL